MGIITTLLLVILLSLIIGAIGIGCFLFGFLNGKKIGRSELMNKDESNSIVVDESNHEALENLAKFINY